MNEGTRFVMVFNNHIPNDTSILHNSQTFVLGQPANSDSGLSEFEIKINGRKYLPFILTSLAGRTGDYLCRLVIDL